MTKKKPVHIYLPEEIYKIVSCEAKSANRTVSNQVLCYISDAVKLNQQIAAENAMAARSKIDV